MTDTAARREARRKRILENSESRLRRITSLNQDGVEDDKPKHNLNSEGSGSVSNSYTSTLEDHESVGEDEEIGSVKYSSKNINSKKDEDSSVKNRTQNRKWILILIVLIFKLSVVLFTKANIFHIETAYVNKIFMPFLLYEVIEIRTLKLSTNENSFISTLLFLSNIPRTYIIKIGNFLNILGVVMQDMFLYFFTFIVVEICIFTCFNI